MGSELNVYGASKAQGVQSVTSAIATSRQAQEVQAMVIMARQFPRDKHLALDRILEDCTRPTLAAAATYEFPRSGTKITGPSIRLAECIAQNWGNLDYGFIELEKRGGESTVMAYAWDLETNTRQSKVFAVKHQRDTQNGSYALTQERDIYELIANQAARRVRSCILALIPGDVIDAALKQCDTTLAAQNQEFPLQERIGKLLTAFQEEFEITPDMVSGYRGKNIEAFTEHDFAHLRRVYTSLKEGIIGNEYFINRMKNSAKQGQKSPTDGQDPEEAQEPEPTKKKAKTAQKPATEEEPPFEMGLDDL